MPHERLRPSFTFDQERIEQLKAIVPEAFVDEKINWDVLHEALGEYLETETTEAEHFGFFWPGKREARRLASIPSTGTLISSEGEGIDEDKTHNLFIEGENLEVLKLLQKSYAGRVKMIYIDPPYNTGNDFIYPDDFADPIDIYLKTTGQQDSDGIVLSSNPETGGRFHSNWLSMMYPRLLLARQLLSKDGVIFISIDDTEASNLRKLCDEVFGEENFVATFPWRKRTAKSDVPFGVSQDFEWILCIAKSDSFVACTEGSERRYFETPDLPKKAWRIHDMTKQTTASERPNSFFTMVDPKTGKKYPANPNSVWRITKDTFQKYYDDKRIVFPGDYDFLNISQPVLRYFKEDDEKKAAEMFGFVPVSTNLPKEVGMTQDGTKNIDELFESRIFSFPKPVELIKHLIKFATSIDKNALILDFFAGSGTTAHAVMALNQEDEGARKYIMVQLPEPASETSDAFKAGYKNIAEIGKERIKRASAKIGKENAKGDIGFRVFKLQHSNYKAWEDYRGDDIKQLELLFDGAVTPLIEGWTSESLLTEIMLIQGFPLDSTINAKPECKQNTVKIVSSPTIEHQLLTCMDDKISEDTLSHLKFNPGDIFVCLDSAVTDQVKMRLANRCNLRTI